MGLLYSARIFPTDSDPDLKVLVNFGLINRHNYLIAFGVILRPICGPFISHKPPALVPLCSTIYAFVAQKKENIGPILRLLLRLQTLI